MRWLNWLLIFSWIGLLDILGVTGSRWVERSMLSCLRVGLVRKGRSFGKLFVGKYRVWVWIWTRCKNDKVNESEDEVIDISSGGRMKTLVVKTDEQVLAFMKNSNGRLKWQENASR